MNILVLAPHPDDEAIGCGGTVALHAERGDRVVVAFLTSGERGLAGMEPAEARRLREAEAGAAGVVLGATDLAFLRRPDMGLAGEVSGAAAALRPLLEREAPAMVFLPHPRENHPDHQACLPILRSAWEGAGLPAGQFWTYEVWTPLGEYDHVYDITPVMRRKLQAIRCYRSQLETFRYDRAARGLGLYRGALAAACAYAEVFLYTE